MANRSPLTASSKLRTEIITPPVLGDSTIDIPKPVTYNEEVESVNRISVQLKFPAKVIRVGLVSGEQYEWAESGSIVSVLREDVEQLLQLKIGDSACCGGNPNFLFELV